MTDIIRRALKPGDLVVYLLVAAAAVCSAVTMYMWGGGGTLYAEVVCAGTRALYPLDEDAVIPLSAEGYTLTLVISGGEAYISESDCPDRICVHTGRISKSGQAIVCVPARTTVKITGGDADIDFIAG